ncbi:hypothetical protein QR680_009911 [Steinernema hermaphroditum]|uniref:Cytochrome P450 n=1 Tax=Steinernema hermaphroditum TaxID=289476 RepID=A0AA39IPK3_9BILA|nr:hypothetical protein QR680_009911 [Steinernema hermaphroditum]
MLSPLVWVLLFIVVYFLSWRRKKVNSLPPGPFAWPLLGNYVQMGIAHWKGISLVEWYEQCKRDYGSVFTVWIGPMPVVMVVDYDVIHETFKMNGEPHNGRQKAFVFTGYREKMGLIWSDGDGWQEQRRFSLRVLRDFGFGRNIMQQRILEEISYRFERLDRELESVPHGKLEFRPTPFLDVLVGSVINKILVGYRYDDHNIEELRKLKGGLDMQLDALSPVDVVVFYESTYQLPLFKQRYDVVATPQVEIIEHLRGLIEKRRKAIQEGTHVIDRAEGAEDYIDAYLMEMQRREEDGEPMGYFSDKWMAANLLDLFFGGTETSISSLLWAFLFIMRKPEIQEKLRAEVLRTTGGNRCVEITDKANMPYANAVVTETLRCSNIVTFNILHETTTESVVGGFKIPTGTVIVPQMSVAMRDKTHFENPLEFNPDRYLDPENGKQLEKKVIPFSVGKRACLGESLARAEIFLFLTNFVQRYKFSPVPGQALDLRPIALATNLNRTRPYVMMLEKFHL